MTLFVQEYFFGQDCTLYCVCLSVSESRSCRLRWVEAVSKLKM